MGIFLHLGGTNKATQANTRDNCQCKTNTPALPNFQMKEVDDDVRYDYRDGDYGAVPR